jgi:signal transduction histidine kinase
MSLHFIEPAARIITAIGRDLIKDVPASIVELVKNSYDADASFVSVIFDIKNDELLIKIIDDGHGMDKDTIVNTWLVPGTDYKLLNKKSPLKRPYQGRKGIGRYAAAVLGNKLELESIQDGIKTIAKIDWTEFEKKKYLKDVEISLETEKTNLNNGTTLIIKGGETYINLLNKKEVDDIIRELRKLVSPLENKIDDEFKINTKFNNFHINEYKNKEIKIEPFPILEMYNYRLSGTIYSTGKAKLIYENGYQSSSNDKSTIIKELEFQLDEENEYYCGEIQFDLRVFDKDDEGINYLVNKLQNQDSQETIGRRFAKQLLKESTGVGIYRNGFRIRPYGDPTFDWLNLDNRRVQNPSYRIGLDQIAGFVTIQPEEMSFLEEKSARDGLKESRYFQGLRTLILKALTELEKERFDFRQLKIKETNSKSKSGNRQVDSLFDLSEFNSTITKNVENSINKIKDNPEKVLEYAREITENVNKTIQSFEKQKNEEYEKVKQIMAIYQGQATLGKIVTVILHEGRKSVGWFTNQLPRIVKWLKRLEQEENINNELLNKIQDRLETTQNEARSLTNLFNKLDPLTASRRSKPSKINLYAIVQHVFGIFENDFIKNNITFNLNVEGTPILYGIKEDFLMCITNLIENSIYWIKQNPYNNRYINVDIVEYEELIVAEIIDNGPGIEQKYIESESIFEPGFSGKSDNTGTGLGLAIAGEAMERNGGNLKAIYNPTGAHFKIEIKKRGK